MLQNEKEKLQVLKQVNEQAHQNKAVSSGQQSSKVLQGQIQSLRMEI